MNLNGIEEEPRVALAVDLVREMLRIIEFI